MRYRRKVRAPVEVDAFQMTRERRQDNTDWPEWLNYAWNHERGEVGGVWPCNADSDGTDHLMCGTPEGAKSVLRNDYIVRFPDASLRVWGDLFVETRFEPVETGGCEERVAGDPICGEHDELDCECSKALKADIAAKDIRIAELEKSRDAMFLEAEDLSTQLGMIIIKLRPEGGLDYKGICAEIRKRDARIVELDGQLKEAVKWEMDTRIRRGDYGDVVPVPGCPQWIVDKIDVDNAARRKDREADKFGGAMSCTENG